MFKRIPQTLCLITLVTLTSACKTTQSGSQPAVDERPSVASNDRAQPAAPATTQPASTEVESPETLPGLKKEHPLNKVYKKARNGDAVAQFKLGGHYDFGNEVKKDDAKAVEWYTRSVALGNVDAMQALGMMYQYGEGTEKNSAQAVNLFEQAANKGNVLSQNTLAAIYAAGDGVTQNLPKAYAWYRVLAENKQEGASASVARIAKQLSPVQLQLANQMYQHYSSVIKSK